MSAFSRWISATIEPIGSSTSGIQISSGLATAQEVWARRAAAAKQCSPRRRRRGLRTGGAGSSPGSPSRPGRPPPRLRPTRARWSPRPASARFRSAAAARFRLRRSAGSPRGTSPPRATGCGAERAAPGRRGFRRPRRRGRRARRRRARAGSQAGSSSCREQQHADADDGKPKHRSYRMGMDALARLREAPGRAAVLLDLDGTLAPIVARPEDAAVPEETRAVLRDLAARYALVAAITGRPGVVGRELLGVDEMELVGSHGLELAAGADEWRARLQEFRGTVDWPVEDKGLGLSYHSRTHEDPEQARVELEQVAERARDAGLRARFGRMVLELLPPLEAHKGTAVRALLQGPRLTRALFAGDDTTDLDAFSAVEELEVGVKVAVESDEAPPELVARADLVVAGPAGLVELLRTL